MYKALVLIFLIGLLAFSGSSVCGQNSSPDTQSQESPTGDEVREARELARRFMTQLEQKQNANGLIDELFVKDFVQRLRTTPNPLLLFNFDKDVSAAASDEQLKRFYVNTLNILFLGMRICVAMEIEHRKTLKPDASPDEAGFEPTLAGFEAIMPRELFELVSNDPVVGPAFTRAIEEERRNEAKARNAQQDGQSDLIQLDDAQMHNDSDGEEDLTRISTIDRMNHYNDLIEKAAAIVRKRLKEMPPDLAPDIATVSRIWRASEGEPPTEDPIVVSKEDNFMGYPPQTRIFSASALFLHIDMVKDYDGQLRIAAVHMIDD